MIIKIMFSVFFAQSSSKTISKHPFFFKKKCLKNQNVKAVLVKEERKQCTNDSKSNEISKEKENTMTLKKQHSIKINKTTSKNIINKI